MNDKTMVFKRLDDASEAKRKKLRIIYDALLAKGYNPINQIVGFILSGDPTYITTHNDARKIIQELDRDEILQDMVEHFLNGNQL